MATALEEGTRKMLFPCENECGTEWNNFCSQLVNTLVDGMKCECVIDSMLMVVGTCAIPRHLLSVSIFFDVFLVSGIFMCTHIRLESILAWMNMIQDLSLSFFSFAKRLVGRESFSPFSGCVDSFYKYI